MYIYLIEAQNGLAKIGYSRSPHERALHVMSHSPIGARLIAYWPGNKADEARLHEIYAEYRSHREWFRIEGLFQEFVERNRGRGVKRIPERDAVLAPTDRGKGRTCAVRSAIMRQRWADPEWRARTTAAMQNRSHRAS